MSDEQRRVHRALSAYWLCLAAYAWLSAEMAYDFEQEWRCYFAVCTSAVALRCAIASHRLSQRET